MIEPLPHVFAYEGKDIEAPLLALLERQKAKIAALDVKISELPAASVEAAQKPTDLLRPAKPIDTAAVRLLGERNTLLVGKRETELWIAEARRCPESVWYLTMSDLALLYEDVDVLGLTG